MIELKKFTSLLLMLSILSLSGNLFAKEKRGANIAIYKIRIDEEKLKMKGTPWETAMPDIKGELIVVKQNSLLLLERESGADMSVDIGDIRIIRIEKKSKAWKYGLVIGGGVGLIAGIASIGEVHGFFATFIESLIFIGLPVTGIVAIIAGKDKTIQFEGKSDSEIKEILEKLRKKARIKNSQ
ncbi:MAG: hypothetical protein ACFFCW_17985 [Candidatus Hodarchaeota archaeon]